MTDKPKIEKGIPIPAAPLGRPKGIWWEMEVGDSAFFASGKIRNISSSVTRCARANGWRFVSRTVTENGIAGTRIWRTK